MKRYCPICKAKIYRLDKKYYPVITYCCFECEMDFVITGTSWFKEDDTK